ncbi:MAG: hypothetical protein ACM3X7_05225 [Solirubrobacterales bacterium]
MARRVGVGHDTYGKGKKILDLENENKESLTLEQQDIINKAKNCDMKVNTAYNDLFGSKEKRTFPLNS